MSEPTNVSIRTRLAGGLKRGEFEAVVARVPSLTVTDTDGHDTVTVRFVVEADVLRSDWEYVTR